MSYHPRCIQAQRARRTYFATMVDALFPQVPFHEADVVYVPITAGGIFVHHFNGFVRGFCFDSLSTRSRSLMFVVYDLAHMQRTMSVDLFGLQEMRDQLISRLERL